MDPNKYFSGYNLKSAERKQKFGFAKSCAREISTLSSVAYKTVDFKKLVIDLLVASESIKRKTRLSDSPET